MTSARFKRRRKRQLRNTEHHPGDSHFNARPRHATETPPPPSARHRQRRGVEECLRRHQAHAQPEPGHTFGRPERGPMVLEVAHSFSTSGTSSSEYNSNVAQSWQLSGTSPTWRGRRIAKTWPGKSALKTSVTSKRLHGDTYLICQPCGRPPLRQQRRPPICRTQLLPRCTRPRRREPFCMKRRDTFAL